MIYQISFLKPDTIGLWRSTPRSTLINVFYITGHAILKSIDYNRNLISLIKTLQFYLHASANRVRIAHEWLSDIVLFRGDKNEPRDNNSDRVWVA